jgi:hypothetical protein
MEQFRGIFRLTYAGDAHLVLRTKVQVCAVPCCSFPSPSASKWMFLQMASFPSRFNSQSWEICPGWLSFGDCFLHIAQRLVVFDCIIPIRLSAL